MIPWSFIVKSSIELYCDYIGHRCDLEAPGMYIDGKCIDFIELADAVFAWNSNPKPFGWNKGKFSLRLRISVHGLFEMFASH